MDGVGSDLDGVFVLAATNSPQALDDAILRRFPKRIYIALPEEDDRDDFFRFFLKGQNTLTNEMMDELAKKTEGYSGSDIRNLNSEASMVPVTVIQQAKYFKIVPNYDRSEPNIIFYEVCEAYD